MLWKKRCRVGYYLLPEPIAFAFDVNVGSVWFDSEMKF